MKKYIQVRFAQKKSNKFSSNGIVFRKKYHLLFQSFSRKTSSSMQTFCFNEGNKINMWYGVRHNPLFLRTFTEAKHLYSQLVSNRKMLILRLEFFDWRDASFTYHLLTNFHILNNWSSILIGRCQKNLVALKKSFQTTYVICICKLLHIICLVMYLGSI